MQFPPWKNGRLQSFEAMVVPTRNQMLTEILRENDRNLCQTCKLGVVSCVVDVSESGAASRGFLLTVAR